MKRDMIRTAWRLFDLTFKNETADVETRFGEIKNLSSVGPLYYRQRPDQAPWPTHATARLAWLILNGAALWLPTPEG